MITKFDYRKLLRKFMDHVKECGGITFIPYNANDVICLTHHEFTQAELDELHQIESEILVISEVIIKADSASGEFVQISKKELADLRLAASYANYD